MSDEEDQLARVMASVKRLFLGEIYCYKIDKLVDWFARCEETIDRELVLNQILVRCDKCIREREFTPSNIELIYE